MLGPLEHFVFGDWLTASSQPAHLVGAYWDGGITACQLHLRF